MRHAVTRHRQGRCRPLLLALGLLLGAESAAWAMPDAVNFWALRPTPTKPAPTKRLVQNGAGETRPGSLAAADVSPPPPPTTTPGTTAPPLTGSPPAPLPPAAPPAPATVPEPTVLMLNPPPQADQTSVTDKWWFWAAIGGVVVVTAAVLLIATRPEGEPSTRLGNMEAFR